MKPERDTSHTNVINIFCTFSNTSTAPMANLVFQVAVPKSQKQQLMPPSSTTIPMSGQVTQMLRIANPTKAPLKLRLKIGYEGVGGHVDVMSEFSGFPPELR
jgi:AP-1 complex subunit gamma-1